MLNINKPAVAQTLHDLAVANNVSDAQMATFIFKNFYVASTHLRISQKIHRLSVAITNLSNTLQIMLIDRVCRYLSRLDGVKVADTHESGSHYFNIGDAVIRVSDHFATKFNCPQTLNIVCESDDFVVTFGNKLLPVHTYDALKQLLRTFTMVCDILIPLADVRQQVKVVEKIVTVGSPSHNDPNWVYVGDLKPQHQDGIRRNVANVKKICHYK